MRIIISLVLLTFLSVTFAEDSGMENASASEALKEKKAASKLGGHAVKYPDLTDNSYSIVDEAKVLSPAQQLSLNKALYSLYEDKKINLKLATIKNLKSVYATKLTFDKYAQASYSEWNIAAAGSDLRILVSFNAENNEISFNGPQEWKKDREEDLKTLKKEYFEPKIKEHKVAEGLMKGMETTVYYLEADSLPSFFGFFVKLILFVAVVGGAVYFAKNNPENPMVIKAKELLALAFEKLKELLIKLVELIKHKLAKK